MQILYGDHYHIHCLTLDHLRQSWTDRADRSVVVTSDCPDNAMSELLVGFGAPIIVFLDEPEHAVAFAMGLRQYTARYAMHFSTLCFCTLYDILMSPQTYCFLSRHLGDDVRDMFAKLLQILTGSVDPAQLEAVMRRAIPDYKADKFTTVADQVATLWVHPPLPPYALEILPKETQALIKEVGKAYRPMFQRRPLLQLEWSRDLFFTCNEGNGYPELIDLTGPARFLIWGPHLHLPKGDWVAKIEIEVAENYSGNQVEADVFDGRDLLVVAKVDLPTAGKFSFNLPFTIFSVQRHLEIRIGLLKGAIEGKFGLQAVSLRRADTAHVVQRAISQPPLNFQRTI